MEDDIGGIPYGSISISDNNNMSTYSKDSDIDAIVKELILNTGNRKEFKVKLEEVSGKLGSNDKVEIPFLEFKQLMLDV